MGDAVTARSGTKTKAEMRIFLVMNVERKNDDGLCSFQSEAVQLIYLGIVYELFALKRKMQPPQILDLGHSLVVVNITNHQVLSCMSATLPVSPLLQS